MYNSSIKRIRMSALRLIQASETSPPATGTDNDRLKRAKEAVEALQGSDDTPAHFRKVWQEFRQAYEDTVNKNSNPDTHRPFPVWALSEFDLGDLEDFLKAGYSQDLKFLRSCAPSAPSHFENRPWKFILYFDYIERQRALAINNICIKRPSLSFNELYEEVQANRLKRIRNHKNPKFEFLPRDFKACLKEIDKVSSDATPNNGSGNATQRKIKREERSDNSSPNDHPAPVGNANFDGSEDDYTAGQGDQDDDLEELSSLLNNVTRRSTRPRVSKSPILMHDKVDEMDGGGEAATPITSTPPVANRELSREQASPSDPFLGEGIFSSIEEQLFQEKRSILLDYERLKTSLKTANQTTETCIKSLEEENAAYTEKATQVLSNQNASFEDMQPALERISYRVANNNKKRKIWEDDNEKRKKLVAELENPEIQAYFKNASL